MPVSKRNKIVALTKVKKTNRAAKEELIDEVRIACCSFKRAYILSFENQRNSHIKLFRDRLKPGRLFYGKNKVIQVALGTLPEVEVANNIHTLSKRCRGERGILFSNDPPEKVREVCHEMTPSEFGVAGTIAKDTVMLQEGVDSLASFPPALEATLRKLGLPTRLSQGRISLLGNHVVCKAGEFLSAQQAQILKLLGIKMARFHVAVEAVWENGVVTEYVPFTHEERDPEMMMAKK